MGEPGQGSRKGDLARRSEAFKLFCRYGNKAEVARRLDVSPATVYGWARSDRWVERSAKIRDRLKIHLEFLREAADDEIAKLLVADIEFLEYLQSVVSESLISQEIRPRSWKDLIDTQKFVLDQKSRILDLMRDRRSPVEITPSPPSAIAKQELVDVERKYLDSAVDNTPSAGGGEGT